MFWFLVDKEGDIRDHGIIICGRTRTRNDTIAAIDCTIAGRTADSLPSKRGLSRRLDGGSQDDIPRWLYTLLTV